MLLKFNINLSNYYKNKYLYKNSWVLTQGNRLKNDTDIILEGLIELKNYTIIERIWIIKVIIVIIITKIK